MSDTSSFASVVRKTRREPILTVPSSSSGTVTPVTISPRIDCEKYKPDESTLIKRVTSHDPDERMPPPDSGKRLSPQQIAVLGRWIEQGAKWQKHWSFLPPQRPIPPAAEQPARRRLHTPDDPSRRPGADGDPSYPEIYLRRAAQPCRGPAIHHSRPRPAGHAALSAAVAGARRDLRAARRRAARVSRPSRLTALRV